MLKIEKSKVLIRVLKDLEEKLGLAQDVKGDDGLLCGMDIESAAAYVIDKDVYQVRSPSLNYEDTEVLDSIKYQEWCGAHNYGLNIPVPTQARGWPPGLIEFIMRVVVTAIDSTLENIYDAKEMDDSVDNLLRGSQSPEQLPG